MLDVITDTFLDALNASVKEVQRLPRVRFEVGLGDSVDTWIRKKHANGAIHEPATLAAMWAVNKITPVTNFFDLGAHFGYFTLFALQTTDANVTAFDMHPESIPVLFGNCGPYAKYVNAIIGDEVKGEERVWISGFNIFEKPDDGWEALANIPGAMKQRGVNNQGRGFAKIAYTTLDAYCKDNPAPDLLKIDVEGFQAKAIRGGLETFRKHKPTVILEVHDPEKLARFGETNASTVEPLLSMGYKAYWCGNHRSPDAEFEPVDVMSVKHERLSIMVFVP